MTLLIIHVSLSDILNVRIGSSAAPGKLISSAAANGGIADMFKARARYDNYMQIDLDSFPLAL